MGSKVSGKMAAAGRVIQVVRPHTPLIKFPNRLNIPRPNGSTENRHCQPTRNVCWITQFAAICCFRVKAPRATEAAPWNAGHCCSSQRLSPEISQKTSCLRRDGLHSAWWTRIT
ncbi:alpha-ketoglutarate dehydrogenase component 4 isoform X2 [Scleropages formosus]|uniref:alpha-ketoglutarate dehydrogenase component 4 isoform X2 n=1 Tax=Scleropages formosus TaxID=113540 RepID=UPI000877FCA6|nr:28S ribosomal protein S36, mitochondrial isoform X2 [Scleropages formosus]